MSRPDSSAVGCPDWVSTTVLSMVDHMAPPWAVKTVSQSAHELADLGGPATGQTGRFATRLSGRITRQWASDGRLVGRPCGYLEG